VLRPSGVEFGVAISIETSGLFDSSEKAPFSIPSSDTASTLEIELESSDDDPDEEWNEPLLPKCTPGREKFLQRVSLEEDESPPRLQRRKLTAAMTARSKVITTAQAVRPVVVADRVPDNSSISF